ncbi:hypothetical protein K501DRAFT_241721 [Backusella circina FSU 941]|nr:hypothetical protein K501DRAFT_241721 [Backusella circina FSU 941]
MGPERTYPYLKRMLGILKDSKNYNLDLHLQVQYLIIDFAMLDSLQYQQQTDSRDIHYEEYTENIIQLLYTCSNVERLGIMYDTKFVSLVTQGTALSETIQQLSIFVRLQKENKIKQLDLIGYNPIQRCPCCSGKEWDHLLIPFIDALSLKRLVLRHVVPTSTICEAFARQESLTRLTLFRSIMTIPSDTKYPLPIDQRPTSIERIPSKIWKQIKHLDILENSEDCSIWPLRYLDKIAERIETLERFSLVFGTSEENVQCLENEGNMFLDNMTMIPENNRFNAALIRLISSSSESLTQMSLVNVPNIESGRVWLK